MQKVLDFFNLIIFFAWDKLLLIDSLFNELLQKIPFINGVATIKFGNFKLSTLILILLVVVLILIIILIIVGVKRRKKAKKQNVVQEVTVNEEQIEQTKVEEVEKKEEKCELSIIYDSLRKEIKSYSLVSEFYGESPLNKNYIAKLFESNGKIYLYLKIDSELLSSLGVQAQEVTEQEFIDLPSKIELSLVSELDNAIKGVKYAMLFNNMQKSEDVFTENSSEEMRKNGFGFFVFSSSVITTANDIYRALYKEIKSFEPTIDSVKSQNPIIKLVKQGENVSVYFSENLSLTKKDLLNVEFKDTPYVFNVQTLSDAFIAKTLIYKVMLLKNARKNLQFKDDFNIEITDNCGLAFIIE